VCFGGGVFGVQKRYSEDFSGSLRLSGLFLGGADLDLHCEPFGFLFNLDFEVSAGKGLHEVLEPLGHWHVEPFVLVDPFTVKVLLPGDAAVNPQVFSLPKTPTPLKTAAFSYPSSPIKRSVKTGGGGLRFLVWD